MLSLLVPYRKDVGGRPDPTSARYEIASEERDSKVFSNWRRQSSPAFIALVDALRHRE
jgi:hypothetical protein